MSSCCSLKIRTSRRFTTRNQQEREQKRRDIGEDFLEKDWIKNSFFFVLYFLMKISKKSARSAFESDYVSGFGWPDVCEIMFRFHSRLSGFYGSVVFQLRCCVENIQNLLYCDLTADISRDKNRKQFFITWARWTFEASLCSLRIHAVSRKHRTFVFSVHLGI